MSQQPDKLFRDKLYQYERAVSPDAWKRIATTRKRAFPAVYKVAATLLLLAAATFIIFRPFDDQSNTPIALDTPDNTVIPPARTETAPAHPLADATTDQQPDNVVQADKGKPKQPRQTNAIARVKKDVKKEEKAVNEQVETTTMETVDDPLSVAIAQATVFTPDAAESPTISPDTSGRKTVTIVMSAEVVNKKYLSQEKIPEATTTPKGASSLRKLLDIAYDLKHNQNPIGDLRQKKDEILAFNFKRGNERNEN